ncbi:hypothetical protein TRFO_18051 [Tritrichomonas foetus]|uniref:BEACH domain-containing protein n=1 Tax=Tritrichomonas foetus TaxID=1144522 RepID=A0A1J4KR17_9EUKA|nr:hypothetical protein TRFO_18051 [Tritrichomonas foetus]|eukprot:OHT12244.1 hypothetical protein TRFO_18051 [Tritrichomonas foetus]
MTASPPIIEILQCFSMRTRVSNDSSAFSSFLKQCKIPSIDRNTLKNISQLIQDTKSTIKAVSTISHLFNFSSDELITLLNFEDMNDTQMSNAMLVILSNAIGFLFTDTDSSYVDNLKLVLRSLCYYTDAFTRHLFWFMYITVLETAFQKINNTQPNSDSEMFQNLPNDLISLIFTQIESNMIDNPRSLEILVKILEKTEDDTTIKSIISLIKKVLVEYIKENIEYDENLLVKIIQPKFEELDKDVLQLLPLLAKKKGSKAVSFLYSSLPKIISNLKTDFQEDQFQFCQGIDFQFSEYHSNKEIRKELHQIPTTISKQKSENLLKAKSEEIVKAQSHEKLRQKSNDLHNKHLQEIPNETLQNKSSDSSNSNKFESLNIEIPDTNISKELTTGAYLSPVLKKKLKKLIPLFNDIHTLYIDAFFLNFAEVAHENNRNYFIFIYFLTHIYFTHHMPKNIFDSLLWDKLFIPSATLFTLKDDPHFNITSFYREKVVMIVIVHGPDFLYDLLRKYRKFPFLFAEIVVRILKHLPNVYPQSIKSKETLEIILKVQENLREIFYIVNANNENNLKDIAFTARSTVFQLFKRIFMSPLPRNLELEIFHDSLSDRAFSTSLFKVLTTELNISNCILLKNIFHILCNSVPHQTAEYIIPKIMMHTSEAIINDPNAAQTILSALFDFLDTVPNTSILSTTLDIIIKMFMKTRHCIFVKGILSKLSMIISKSGLKCFDQLFQLLAMSNDVKVGSLFIITNPQFLVTVFSVFIYYDERQLLFNEINKLCDFSSYNRYQLYEGEIDLLLLDMIYYWPNDFEFRGSFIKNIKNEDEIFNVTLPLFFKSAATRSSEVVAERMVKIVSLRENGRISPIASSFIGFVSPLVETLIPFTTIGYPLGIQQPIFEFDKIPFLSFVKGATIQFFIYIDEFLSTKMNIRPTIFKVSSSKGLFIELFLEGVNIICTVYNKDKPKEETILRNVETNRWNLIAIQTHLSYKILELNIINESKENAQFHFPIKTLKTDFLKFTVGNSTKFHGNRGLLTCIYQLGSFSYFEKILSHEQIFMNLFDNIPSNYYKPQPLYTFPILKQIPIKEVRLCTNKHDVMQSFPNLVNIFRNYYPVDRFLPIFDKFDKYSSNFSQLLIKTLQGFFGPTINRTFKILPHFLLKTRQKLLFAHYLYLFNFIHDCHTEKDKFSLIDNILCNFEIWIKSPPAELDKIIRHITKELFFTCTSYFLQDNFFPKFLAFLRLYLIDIESSSSFNTRINESNILKNANFLVENEDENDNENSKYKSDDFIKSFDTLMIERAALKFTQDDAEMYLCTILSSNSEKLSLHLLNLFSSLLIYTSPTKKIIYYLLNINFITYSSLFTPLLRCLKYTSKDFYVSILLLSSRITQRFFHENLFDDLTAYPEIFPLALLITVSSEKHHQISLVNILIDFSEEETQRSLIKKCQFWALWPLVFGLQVDTEVQSKVSIFLAQMITLPFDQESLDYILITLKIIQASSTLDTTFLLSSILSYVYEISSESLDTFECDILIKRFFFAMYVECRFGSFSNQLLEIFENSPFGLIDYCMKNVKSDSKSLKAEFKNPKINNFFQNMKNDIDQTFGIGNNESSTNCYNIYDYKRFVLLDELKTIESVFNAFHFDDPRDINFMMILKPIDQNLRSNTLFISEKFRKHNYFVNLLNDLFVIENSPIKKSQSYISIFKEYTSIISPFLKNIKENSTEKRGKIHQFFNGFNRTTKIIDSISYEDPLKAVKVELASNSEQNKLFSTTLMNNFLSTEQFRIVRKNKNNEHKRSFIFSENFNSTIVKKSLKLNRVPKSLKSKQPYAIVAWPAKKISIDKVKNAMLYVFSNKFIIDVERKKTITIKASSLRYILTRSRIQKTTALEFFTIEGFSYLLDFAPNDSNIILHSFESIRMKNLLMREDSNFSKFIYQNGLLRNWESGKLTNFDFLLKLNMFSGRSFKDPSNSVIFPIVELADGKSRDFSSPMPTQDSARLAHFIQVLDMNNYMFGTSPSNSMLLSYYFVRLQPYTNLHLQIHDGHFDDPERMFKNYSDFFKTLLSNDEWKECSPEFYCFPEIFFDLNENNIKDLSTKCKNLYDFVYMNRKALESEYVSIHLCEWIDLIWGVSQRSNNAVYWTPYLYNDCWGNNECEKEMIPSMLENLGSIPPQIFQTHVKRKMITKKKCLIHEIIKISIPQSKKKLSRNAFIFEKNKTTRLIICFEDGTIQRFSINLFKNEVEPVYLAPLRLNIPADAKFIVQHESVFIFDEKSERIHCINFEQIKTVNIKMSTVDFAVGCSIFGNLVTVTKSGAIKLWKFPKCDDSISLFSMSIESISAVDINPTYNIFICCTNDGFMRTYSVHKKKLLNSVNINCIVEKVLTTNSWNFIILYSPGYLHLFTINGFLIKKVQIDFEVSQWSTFVDQDGFDHICCADPIGYIYTFEAYYIENINQIASCNERIISVIFHEETHSIVAHASSSTTYFIPYR